jgi:hypothetical protein
MAMRAELTGGELGIGMDEGRRGKPGRKGGRAEGKEFMDAAREAFVRYVALAKWREIQDMRETLGFDGLRAARDAGQFPGRGPYQALWARRWQERVLPEATGADPGRLFAAIEGAVGAALRDEEAQRTARADRPLEEDPEYKGFLDAALERLFRETAGELEPA